MGIKETLVEVRSKVGQLIFAREYERIKTIGNGLLDMYNYAPYVWRHGDIEDKITALREVADPRMLDFVFRQMKYDRIGIEVNDETRQMAIEQSRISYLDDPIVQFIYELWTDFGVGLTLDVLTRDEVAQEVWDEFFTADRNQYLFNLQELNDMSITVLRDGELFIIMTISTVDGEATVRYILTDEIVKIIRNPDDKMVPVFYKRRKTSSDGKISFEFYQDYRATEKDIAKIPITEFEGGEKVNNIRKGDKTKILMIPVQYRRSNGRGWPLMTAGFAWSEAYKNFAQDRAAVSRAAAAFPEKMKVKGGTRSLDAIKQVFNSSLSYSTDYMEKNPPAPAGSVSLENDLVERQWRNIRTGGVEAKTDGQLLKTQAGLAGKVYPHYLGEGDAYRLATATAMEGPIYKSFNRYKNFWAWIWREVAKLVLKSREQYQGYQFKSLSVDVNLDTLIDVDLQAIINLGNMFGQMKRDGLLGEEEGAVYLQEIIRLAMQAAGINDFADIMKSAGQAAETDKWHQRQRKISERWRLRKVLSIALQAANVDDKEQVLAKADDIIEGLIVGEVNPPIEIPNEEVIKKKEEDIKRHKQNFEKALAVLVTLFYQGKIYYAEFVRKARQLLEEYYRMAWWDGLEMTGINTGVPTLEENEAFYSLLEEQFNHLTGLASYLQEQQIFNDKKREELKYRETLWVNAFLMFVSFAMVNARHDPNLRWELGMTEKHCVDCLNYNGIVKSASYWKSIGAWPQSRNLACGGYNCDCRLIPTNEPETPGDLMSPLNAVI